MVASLYSSINAGVCNQFVTHYVTKSLRLERGYTYGCGIQFVAEGFSRLDSQCVPVPECAINLNKQMIREVGSLYRFPFHDNQSYRLTGMLGAMEDAYFPGVIKHPVCRQFHFNDVKENITQYQFIFTNKDLLEEFTPRADLAKKLRKVLGRLPGGFLVGIHRRRADYASWNEGLYMDKDEQIIEKMQYFRSESGVRRPTFVLCTDEPESAGAFSGEPDVVFVNAEKELEWLILQQTDFIIGAVSTFTFTAAGFKSIPYVFANEVINDDFLNYVRTVLANRIEST